VSWARWQAVVPWLDQAALGDTITTLVLVANQCGNGHVDVGEECDDRNTVEGDGCDGTGACNGAGACVAETELPLDCDDDNAETLDYCDPHDGCHHIRPQVCTGDCNGDGQVTNDELILVVRIGLEAVPVSACGAGDANAVAGRHPSLSH
jgi:cysteine-rich repeat protein